MNTVSPSIVSGRHHARYIRPDIPYHVISRVFQGRHLLTPGNKLNRIVNGVVGRAQELFTGVRLYAITVMSNHLHLMVQGPADELTAFVGYLKREISRRWGNDPAVGWPGVFWEGYEYSALPTADSQINCLKYILSQGVKEKLVAKPQQWPGVHCAVQLMGGKALWGQWFDGTRYAKHVDKRKRGKRRRAVRRGDYLTHYEIRLDQIPAWSHLSRADYTRRVETLVHEIIEEGRRARGGRKPLGAKAVRRTPQSRRSSLPRVPWLKRGRRLICWASELARETREYLSCYWEFQGAFRIAASAWLRGGADVQFPAGAFTPPRFVCAP